MAAIDYMTRLRERWTAGAAEREEGINLVPSQWERRV